MYISGMSNNYTIPISSIKKVTPINTSNDVFSSAKINPTKECSTCENRQYVDDSNENNVSFKSPSTISPEESFSKVMSHEREHVKNAVNEGNKPGAQLVSSSVSLKIGVCPECGKSFVEGGVTKTQMKYTEQSPYDKSRKSFDAALIKGMNFDKGA